MITEYAAIVPLFGMRSRAFEYVKIKDREDFWRIIQYEHANYVKYLYCREIKDRAAIWRALANTTTTDVNTVVWYCEKVKNRPEMKEPILKFGSSGVLCRYCRVIEDDEKMWRKLADMTDDYYAKYEYCSEVKDRPEMWKKLIGLKGNDVSAAYRYYANVRKRPEIFETILTCHNPLVLFSFCERIKDNKQIREALMNSTDRYANEFRYRYCKHVKNRPEMAEAIKNSKQSDRDKWWRAYCRWVKEN